MQFSAMLSRNIKPFTQTELRRCLALISAGLAFLLFAGQFIVSRYGVLNGMTPYDIIALRFSVAGIVAVPLLVRWGISDLGGVGWLRGIVLAIFAGAPYYVLMIGGLAYGPAANVVVINPGMTLIGGIFLSICWLGERSSGLRLTVGTVALIGLILVGGEDIGIDSGNTWIGNLMFALSGLMWALYMALLNHWHVNPVRAAIVVSVLSLIYLPAYSVMASPGFAEISLSEVILQGGYQGFVHALMAVALFSYAVRSLGVGTLALMTPIVPVAGLSMAAFFLGEKLSELQWLGAAMVFCAMGVSAWRSRQRTDVY